MSRPPLSHRNVRVESFLQRNTERGVYERIRVHEPCVVLSDTINKAYMHVVLSDERVYLTEFPPRTLTAAVSFGRVRDIELVNDLPEFLSVKDRERCQHIRIVYDAETPAEGARDWLRVDGGAELPPLCPPTPSDERSTADRLPSLWRKDAPLPALRSTRSPSCPDLDTLGLLRVPQLPFTSISAPPSPNELSRSRSLRRWSGQQGRISSAISRLLRRGSVGGAKEKEAELHLYAVSHSSRLYLHLQSSWNSFIIKSTLMLDPFLGRRCSATPDSSTAISSERTARLFSQLSSELLQDGISMEKLYVLLQELCSAARRLVTLRRLFWRSAELCVFLVRTLEECLRADRTADNFLLSTLIVQTLAVMFRETELESARISLLSDKKGALASRLLLALVCDPEGEKSLLNSEVQLLLSDFLDSSCSLMFELLLLGHETSRFCSAENILTVGWILRVLQTHPHLLAFLAHQAQQVVRVLQLPVVAPLQAVLLYQRCRLLLDVLQHCRPLAEHLQSQLEEEFRYFVKASFVQTKLPPQYPISRPTLTLLHHIQTLILRT